MQLNKTTKLGKYSYFIVAGILFNFCMLDLSAHLYNHGAHKIGLGFKNYFSIIILIVLRKFLTYILY